MSVRRPHIGAWLALATLLLLPTDGWSESYALDPEHDEAGREIHVELSHGVSLRFDGATQLRLETSDQTLAQVELRVAADAESDPPALLPGSLESRLHHWGYYHVDGIAFWEARADVAGDPVLATVDGLGWQRQRHTVLPHVSVGRVDSRMLDLFQRRLETGSGPLYVGWVRLDGREDGRASESSAEVRWSGDVRWPLAFLVARTQEELLFQAGQAQWTFDQVEDHQGHRWIAPPLCARCRNPEIGRLRLQLEAERGSVRLHAVFDEVAEPRLVSAEGLTLVGRRLGDDLVAEGESGASYEISRDDPWLEEVLEAARRDLLEATVPMATGLWVEPKTIEIRVDPSLQRPQAPETEADLSESLSAELPDHLSPHLVQSWPNPFRDQTNIEVTIPSTLGEAFELDEEMRRKVDVRAAPPFGPAPLVRVRVYNVGGQLIQLLEEDVHAAGRFAISWDGRDLQGRPVAAGAYYVNVEMGEWKVTKRVLRLKP